MIRDLFSLCKPRLSALVIVTAAIGAVLHPVFHENLASSSGFMELIRVTLAIFGVTMLVGSANAFNCYLEREIDRHMKRTQDRPLATGRLSPRTGFIWASFLFVVSILLIDLNSNTLSTVLGLVAFATYVLVYTPLKQKSKLAVYVGALPGALPPVIGWTIVAGDFGLVASILFSILFLWQIPHFIAIAVFRDEEYRQAGLITVPQVDGERSASLQLLGFSSLLILVSFLPCAFDLASRRYLVGAVISGIVFLGLCLYSLQKNGSPRWMRFVFFGTLAYLPIVLGLWLVDQMLFKGG